ncbi:remorin [Cajanus cajan]|uniref:remorin n=1 Tax=Cajanus cajan TaxID=3821 RepID=UPI00098DB235|nr:remorin [Cajanus cajan]
MENFFNQMRVKTSGAEESKAGLGSPRDQKIPIQKTRPFKGEKKQGGQNWFQKQFARRSGDHDSRDMDHAAAVAAAAFAINLQDVSEQKSETLKASLTKTKSKVDGTKPQIPLLSSASKRLSGSFRSKDDKGKKVPKSLVTDEKKPEEAITPSPSMKKTSTFTNEKPETTMPDPVRQPIVTERHTKANEWEKAELEDIRQRYDDLREVIDSWQNKKKMKARRKLNKEERGLAQRRMKASEDFQNKITAIDKIAEGARTKAEESRKNEELKAKEKANVIRTTGKLPGICFCF